MVKSQIIGALILLACGIFIYKFPKKFLEMPFIDSALINTEKSVKAWWTGHKEAYGENEGIKKIKKLGKIFILAGIILSVYYVFF